MQHVHAASDEEPDSPPGEQTEWVLIGIRQPDGKFTVIASNSVTRSGRVRHHLAGEIELLAAVDRYIAVTSDSYAAAVADVSKFWASGPNPVQFTA